MQNETAKNPLALTNLPSTATHCDGCNEESMCNCENNERITPYFSDDGQQTAEQYGPKCHVAIETAQEPLQSLRQACKSVKKRLRADWRASGKNPYLKQTSTMRLDLYRSHGDVEPIDSFYTESVKSYSLKTVALIGLGAVVLVCTTKCILKKLWK